MMITYLHTYKRKKGHFFVFFQNLTTSVLFNVHAFLIKALNQRLWSSLGSILKNLAAMHTAQNMNHRIYVHIKASHAVILTKVHWIDLVGNKANDIYVFFFQNRKGKNEIFFLYYKKTWKNCLAVKTTCVTQYLGYLKERTLAPKLPD